MSHRVAAGRAASSLSVWGFLTLLVCGCAPPNEYKAPPPPVVFVSPPLEQNVTIYLEETGTTEAVGMVKIRARVTGFIESIDFETDEEVTEDQTLYTIEKQTYEAAVEKAKADLAVAQAQYVNADARYRGAAPLVEKGIVTREEMDQRKADRSVAQANIYAAQAELEARKIDLNYCTITTPISGRVGKTLIKKGNLVDGTSGTHLTTVINYDEIYANFYISERALLDITQNYPPERENGEIDKKSVKILLSRHIDGDKYPFEGHLDYWDLGVDESTGTYAIRAVFNNKDNELIPGLQVNVRVVLKEDVPALLVPEAAIGTDQTGRYVLIVDDKNTVKRRAVVPGDRYGDMRVVREGVTTDDRIVVEGIQRARLDAVVDPKPNKLEPPDVDGVSSIQRSEDEDGEPLDQPAGEPLDDSASAIFEENDTSDEDSSEEGTGN